MHSKILPEHCISGRTLEQVDGVVLHYFSAKNVDPALQYDLNVCRDLFLDLNRPKASRRRYMREKKWPEDRMFASAHLLIGRQGIVWKLVEYDKQAYHAGASIMEGRSHCNRWTLGIELVGTQDSGFSKAQYDTLANLLLTLEAEFHFDRDHIQGHDTVRWAAIQAGSDKRPKYDPSGRKDGDGDNFDWYYLGKLMNDILPNPAGVITLDQLPELLRADPNSG